MKEKELKKRELRKFLAENKTAKGMWYKNPSLYRWTLGQLKRREIEVIVICEHYNAF